MKLYLMRHGQTTLNVDRKFYGELDPDLTKLGKSHALCLSKTLVQLVKEPDCIYTSSMKRTKNTAELICQELNWQKTKIVADSRLNEKSFGLWEGLNADEIEAAYPKQWQEYIDDAINYTPEGGETYQSFAKRINKAFEEIIDQSWQEGREELIIVGHNGVLRDLAKRYLEIDKDYWDIYFYQGEVHVYDIEDKAELKFKNISPRIYK